MPEKPGNFIRLISGCDSSLISIFNKLLLHSIYTSSFKILEIANDSFSLPALIVKSLLIIELNGAFDNV
jgi:hypothetical protein